MGPLVCPDHRRGARPAAISARGSIGNVRAGAHSHCRRPVRSSDEFDESGGNAPVDALARASSYLAAGRRQFLLYGLPVHAGARFRAALVTFALALAETAALQMARRCIAGGLPLGL